KLLVINRRFSASCHWFWNTSSFHLGMMFEIGQPVSDWQNGTPQSMQRADWYLSSSSVRRLDSSAQSRVRVAGLRYFSLRRLYFMKPRVLSKIKAVRFFSVLESVTLSSMSSKSLFFSVDSGLASFFSGAGW